MNQCKDCRYYDEYPIEGEPKGRRYCWRNDVSVWNYEDCPEWEKNTADRDDHAERATTRKNERFPVGISQEKQ